MKLRVICIGKTNKGFIQEGLEIYLDRLKHYSRVDRIEIPDVRNGANLSTEQLKEAEGLLFLKNIEQPGLVILMDEHGKQWSSTELADRLVGFQNRAVKNVNLLIGGAFGFSSAIHSLADEKWSLSKMTFSHQMARVILAEQLYRAQTIIKGESYHHE